MLKALFHESLRNVISLVGIVLTTVAAVLFFTLFAIEEFAHTGGGAYTGIIAFIIVPSVFVLGLLLIPVGVWRYRKAEAKRIAAGQAPKLAPVIDFNNPRTRIIVLTVAALTAVNMVIVATATYKGIETMESTEFCGTTCHAVMSPEFTTYSRSPHSRVRCTQCHIGPGANWFVKSKISGSWQLISVAFNLYPRPISTPVESLRPSRDTCEQCHWPTKFVGPKLKVIRRFDEDEKNTAKKTVLLLKVGGGFKGQSRGIHWHVDPNHKVRYQADKKRTVMAQVELTDETGKVTTFTNSEVKPEAGAEWRTMDCIDCHNRPTHVYERPRDVVDRAMEHGDLDRELPFLRREALRIIQLKFASQDEAKTGIKAALLDFYAKEYPELAKTKADALAKAADAIYAGYATNVFPQMNIQWGTYQSFRFDEGGCFRCHNGDLKGPEDKKISKKCDLCHEVLAESEEEPEILGTLNME